MTLSKQKKSQALVKKSESVLDVFRSTMVKLEDVNDEIVAEEVVLAAKQQAIQDERDSLEASKAQNAKVVAKIQQFFE